MEAAGCRFAGTSGYKAVLQICHISQQYFSASHCLTSVSYTHLHAFINFASDYAGAYDNSSYVGYTSANQEVMDAIYGEGGEYEGIDAYIPRTDNKNDEVFEYNAETKKIIGDLWSRVKIAASNAR